MATAAALEEPRLDTPAVVTVLRAAGVPGDVRPTTPVRRDLENASRRESETRESSYQCEEELLIVLVERTVDEDVGWPGMATPGGHRGGLAALLPVSLRSCAAPFASTPLPRRPRLGFDEPDTLLVYEYRIHELGHTLELGRGHPQLVGGLLE